jgi:Family of unknown function (DUF6049)
MLAAVRLHSRAPLGAAAVALGLVLGLTTAFHPPPAAAQEADAGVTVKLLGQPVAARPDDTLSLRLRVSNDSPDALEGFGLSIAAYGHVDNRSELHSAFDSVPGEGVASSYRKEYPKTTLAPGEARDVVVDDPISTLVSLRDETESGVYPLTVTLFTADGVTPFDSLTTFLLYYPTPPEVPLNFVLVVPVNAVPAEGPDGVFRPDATGAWPLEDALAGDGWLRTFVGALDRWAGGSGVHLAIAPTPRLVEEMSHLAQGYERGTGAEVADVPASEVVPKAATAVLDKLREVLARPGVQPLLAPYSFPDLPALARASEQNLDQEQVQVGQSVLNEALELDLQARWLFPPAGRLDPASLKQLSLTRSATRTFFSEGALEEAPDPAQSGCPGPVLTLTFACPVEVANPSTGGSVVGYLADQGVQDRFAALAQGGDSRLDLQELFAETAMVHAELPGQPERILHAAVPSLWHPPGPLVEAMLRGFARAPWLDTVTPSRGLRVAAAPEPRRLRQSLPPLQNDPGDALLEVVQTAGDTVTSFATINPPEALVRRLSRAVLTAQSRTWWTDPALTARGAAYATAAENGALAELEKITIEADEQITMTSRQAEIPVAVFNDADYPVRIRIQLVSPSLTFETDAIEATFEPPGERLPNGVSATAKSSGIFPLTINIQTPDGRLTFGSKDITVRSTEFNRIALGLTFGALGFLILFYTARALRRRRGGGPEEPAAAAVTDG